MLTSVEQDVAQLLAFLKHIPNVMYYDLVCGSLGDFVKALAAVRDRSRMPKCACWVYVEYFSADLDVVLAGRWCMGIAAAC
jgi:hypothetical protein